MNAIAPSILERVSFDKYVDMPEAHATSLFNILTSPLLYRWRKDNGRPDSDTFRQGRAAHTAILEPDRFLRDYALWDGGKRDKRIEKYATFLEVNAGKSILTVDQYDTAMRMRDAVSDHPVAYPLLAEKGRSELTMKWQHPGTGTWCKGRLDRLTSNLIDLKSSRDVEPVKFGRSAANYGYAFQLAFYRDGVIVIEGRVPAVKIVAVQNCAPYDVAVFDVPAEVLARGNEQVERAMALLDTCTKSGKWPGVAPDAEVPLVLPAWANGDSDDVEITFGGEAML